MESGLPDRLAFERSYQRRRLDDYFFQRSLKEDLDHSLPFLTIGEGNRRAKARGVYILTVPKASAWGE
jgi:hypothetical protein